MRRLLICFDVDGTLIDDTTFIWQTLHDRIQTDPGEREYWSNEYWAGRITYAEWASKDVEMWIRKGVTRTDLKRYLDELNPMPGAFDILTELHARGHLLGVISGSLDIAIEQAFPDHIHLFQAIYLNKLCFDTEGRLAGVSPTPFDIEHKATGLREMAHATGHDLADTVFIGDNFNDIEVARIAGCSIAFNCKSEELAKISTYRVVEKDLRAALPLIDDFARHQYDPKDVKS